MMKAVRVRSAAIFHRNIARRCPKHDNESTEGIFQNNDLIGARFDLRDEALDKSGQ